MKPLLSIVVPTKDRYGYLKNIIELIIYFGSEKIELVIQDNTKNNAEIIDYLNIKNSKIIKYYHTPHQIPISNNCDLSILNSSGEYVCMIGDDDGVTRDIIPCVKWMKKNNIDALIPADIEYKWPDFITGTIVKQKDVLLLNNLGKYSNKAVQLSPIDTVIEAAKKGFQTRGNLPLVYHGIVLRERLNQIYDIGNTFFPGPSPDIANGVALAFFIQKYIRLDFPLIVSGQSKMHGGGIRMLKEKLANIDDVPFLPKNAKRYWEKNIPDIWAGETVWPESAIKALRYMNKDGIINKVNYNIILVTFILNHPLYAVLGLKKVRNLLSFNICFIKEFSKRLTKAAINRFNRYILRQEIGKNKKVHGLKNIFEVCKYLAKSYKFDTPKM